MQIADINQNSRQWLEFRRGKITGTSLGQLYQARQWTKTDITQLLDSKGAEYKKSAKKDDLELLLTDEDKAVLAAQADKKIEFYRVMADKLAEPEDDENRMKRGLRLEQKAADRFSEETGKKLIQVGCCVSDIDDRIINSPDRLVDVGTEIFEEAVEIKNLNNATHLQVIVENEVPDEYFTQKVQYFVVNEKLKRCFWVFHNDRFSYKNLQMHVIEVTRESLGDWPQIMLNYQLNQLKQMDEIIERLAF